MPVGDYSSSYRLSALHGIHYSGGNIMFDPSIAVRPTATTVPAAEGVTIVEDISTTTAATSAAPVTTAAAPSAGSQTLLSPVRDHLTCIQMQSGSTRTHTVCNSSLQCFDVAPDGDLVIAIGSRGLGTFYSRSSELPIDTISFPPQCNIRCVKFSPCARFVAVGMEATLQIFLAPAQRTVRYHGVLPVANYHHCLTAEISSIEWTGDSKFLLVSGADGRMKVMPRQSQHKRGVALDQNFLIGHRKGIVGAYFIPDRKFTGHNSIGPDLTDPAQVSADTKHVLSVSSDNVVIFWKRSETTRRELIHAVVTQKLLVQTQGSAFAKKRPHDGEEDEDEDDAENDAELVPESFIERQRREKVTALLTEADLDTRLANHRRLHATPDDTTFADVLRYTYQPTKRHMLRHPGDVTAAAYHAGKALLVMGYSTGSFALHSADLTVMESFPLIQLLSVSSQMLTAAAFSTTGDYVAVASPHLKQLVVWDWKAEGFVLKEQSHYYDINTCQFNADASVIVTGGEEGKVKLWNAMTGQCLVTFAEHVAGVVSVAMSPSTNAFFTASKDGSVRAYDMSRYRNFRVFQPSAPTQFSCVATDSSGEIVAASSARNPTVTLWATQTGKIIDEFTGHDGPVACVAFHTNGRTMYTCGGSDRTMMVWEVFSTDTEGGEKQRHYGESIALNSEPIAVSVSLNGRRMAVLLSNGEVTVFDVVESTEPEVTATFSTSMDAAGGWSGQVGPNSKNNDCRFTTIALSPEGDRVLLGGDSRWIALYHSQQGFLLNKWPVTTNMDMEGAVEQFDYRNFSEAGMLNDIDAEDDDPQLRAARLLELPGAKNSHFATGKRKTKLMARTMSVAFSSSGRDFLVASTDGLQHFSLDHTRRKFSPLQLTASLTPATVKAHLDQGKYALALAGALLLNDAVLGLQCIRKTPKDSIAVSVKSVPTAAFAELIRWVASDMETTTFVEQALTWGQCILLSSEEPLWGPRRDPQVATALRLLHKSVTSVAVPLKQCLSDCSYAAQFMVLQRGVYREVAESHLAATATEPTESPTEEGGEKVAPLPTTLPERKSKKRPRKA